MTYTKKIFYKIKHIPAMLGIGALTALPVACGDEKLNIIEKESEPIIKRDTTYLPKPDTTYLPKRDTVFINKFDTLVITQNDIVVVFNRSIGPSMDSIKGYADCDTIQNVFLIPDGYWMISCWGIRAYRNDFLQPLLDYSPKIHGRGDFHFRVGEIFQEDSLWYVANGWTINKYPEESLSLSISFDDNSKYKKLLVGSIAVFKVVIRNNTPYLFNPEWSSDNPAVAIVDNNGVVTALSSGTAHITVSMWTLSDQCTVSVIEESNFNVEPEYVDLGLSVKWATYNVGATKPEEYGDYYAWGETETKSTYNLSTYKWCNGSVWSLTKYNTISDYGMVDNKTILDPEDDVAHVKWGGNWRMPTKAEQDELCTNCTWTWTTLNGVNGYRVTSNKTGYTDRSIFLPAAGLRSDTRLFDDGYFSCYYYWSSSLYSDYPGKAWYSDGVTHTRGFGQSVRPVCP